MNPALPLFLAAALLMLCIACEQKTADPKLPPSARSSAQNDSSAEPPLEETSQAAENLRESTSAAALVANSAADSVQEPPSASAPTAPSAEELESLRPAVQRIVRPLVVELTHHQARVNEAFAGVNRVDFLDGPTLEKKAARVARLKQVNTLQHALEGASAAYLDFPETVHRRLRSDLPPGTDVDTITASIVAELSTRINFEVARYEALDRYARTMESFLQYLETQQDNWYYNQTSDEFDSDYPTIYGRLFQHTIAVATAQNSYNAVVDAGRGALEPR